MTIQCDEGNVESITYSISDNASYDITSDCTITLDSPLSGLTVSNGGITFTVDENTVAGTYTRTMTAHYTVTSQGETREVTDTATVSVTVTEPEQP